MADCDTKLIPPLPFYSSANNLPVSKSSLYYGVLEAQVGNFSCLPRYAATTPHICGNSYPPLSKIFFNIKKVSGDNPARIKAVKGEIQPLVAWLSCVLLMTSLRRCLKEGEELAHVRTERYNRTTRAAGRRARVQLGSANE